MGFNDVLDGIDEASLDSALRTVDEAAVDRVLEQVAAGESASAGDLAVLLSSSANSRLETMAQLASDLTKRRFGRVLILYLPLYLSNHCESLCRYCGFSAEKKIKRTSLTFEEIELEAEAIAASGVRQILLLTGEAPRRETVEYIARAAEICRRSFATVGVEVYAMPTDGYRKLFEAGVDSLTLYQECYDRKIYEKMHPGGEKKDYLFRLEAPERGGAAGFRSLNIGPLLGLAEPKKEAYKGALHAQWLQRRFSECDISLSLPRIHRSEGGFKPPFPVNDKVFVQILLAWRLFLPEVGITLSTRENPSLRDHLIGLGITRISAGSRTTVGGYEEDHGSEEQFAVSDERSVKDVARRITELGYQPVFKDWELPL